MIIEVKDKTFQSQKFNVVVLNKRHFSQNRKFPNLCDRESQLVTKGTYIEVFSFNYWKINRMKRYFPLLLPLNYKNKVELKNFSQQMQFFFSSFHFWDKFLSLRYLTKTLGYDFKVKKLSTYITSFHYFPQCISMQISNNSVDRIMVKLFRGLFFSKWIAL